MTEHDVEADLNIRMVAAGLRPGWLTTDWSVTATRAALKRMGLDGTLAVRAVKVGGPVRLQGALVVARVTGGSMATLRSHRAVAMALGIPCGARAAWMDPNLCHAFIVWAAPPRKVKCKAKPYERDAVYVTSFWCASRADGIRWCKAFIRRAAAFVHAEGLELHFETTTTIQ